MPFGIEPWESDSDMRRLDTFSSASTSLQNTSGWLAFVRRSVSAFLRFVRGNDENGLHGCDALYRILADTSEDFIFLIDREDVVLHVNAFGARSLGMTRKHMIGKKRSELFRGKDSERQRDALVEVMTTGLSMWREEPVAFPSGERVLDTRLVPVRSNDEVVAVLGISRDTTEKKNIADAVRENEQRYRMIFNAANDAMFLHDQEGAGIVDANEKAGEMFGYAVEELKSLSVQYLSWGEEPYSLTEALSFMKSARNDGPRTFEWLCRGKDGRSFWSEVHLKRILLGDRSFILAIVRDISERKKTQDQLHLYSENLERMVEERTRELDKARAELFMSSKLAAMGRLGAGIAHQLNSPLCGSLLIVDSLLETCASDGPAEERLSMLRQTIGGMRDVIDCMLALAMVGKDGSVSRDDVDINAVVRRIVGFQSLECHKRGIRIEAVYARSLPTVFAVVGEFDQVFLNLTNNALEAMGEGGVLSVESLCDGDWIQVNIKDTGEGISGEDLEKIFEPFYTTKRKQRGLGLGLSLVRETVERHGGAVSVTSSPGQGTLFAIRIPARGAHGST
jgi:PAS domain S-box-containing protein